MREVPEPKGEYEEKNKPWAIKSLKKEMSGKS